MQVTNFFSPVHGGSVVSPYQLSRQLAKKGHEVTIYTSDFKLSRDYINSVPAVSVHSFKTWLGLAKFHITPGIIRSTREEIKDLDIIHMHNYRTFQNMVVYHYAKKYGIPYVLQAHGSLVTFFQKGWLKRIYDVVWGYGILKDAARVIAVTQTEFKQYQSMGVKEDKIEIIPHGIDLSEYADLPERGEFKRRYNLDGGQRIILYLGRIHKIKGLDLLSKAFAGLSKLLGEVTLVVAGPDDGYLRELKRLIKGLKIEERVLYTGPLYAREKLEAYVDADLYVLPSVYEIFGITILEACACGIPVVATDRCGIADEISGNVGLVVPYDEEQLQHALLQMLNDDKMRLEFGRKGKELVLETFNWEKVTEQVEKVYEDIL